jgi:hypothetical protein
MATKTDVINLGPMLLLDADTITGNDGDAIGTWSDDSGQSRTFSQSTAGYKPLLKKAANGINSHNALLFDGTDDVLNCSTALSYFVSAGAFTVFTVFNYVAVDPNYDGGTVYRNNAILEDTDSWFGVYLIRDSTIHGMVYDSLPNSTSESITVGVDYKFRFRLDTGKIYHKLNANAETSGVTSGNIGTLTNGLHLAMASYGTATYANIKISEIIIFNSALSSGNMATVDAYLTAKYFTSAAVGLVGDGLVSSEGDIICSGLVSA